ncbi:MAG: hypothetical protein KF718_25085, partial [Polyangiaceae bacterium]|nr:hypothetical protein [Polyangiaceae bacterium]
GCPIVSWSFDTCPSGWTPAGNGNDWACGKPTNGPGGDHTTGSGNAWATNLSSNSANCADSTLTSPVVDLSAHTGQQVRIQYWHWHDFRACNPGGLGGLCGAVCTLENSTYSGGIVEAFNGSSWQKVTPTTGYPGKNIECYYVSADGGTTCSPCALDGQKGFDGASGVWVPIELDVSTFTHAQFQLRFHFASSASDPFCYPPKAGWYIDDVRVAKLSCP